MRRFLLGLCAGLLLAIAATAVAWWWTHRPPGVPSNATLVLRLLGDLPEREPPRLGLPGMPSPDSLTVFRVWRLLNDAAGDSRIRQVRLEIGGLSAGWASLAEVRDALLAFRKSGKEVEAILSTPSIRDYYVASAASKIRMTPGDVLDLRGLSVELMYLGNALEKLGVRAEMFAAGRYKDAPDMFTRSSARPETRAVIDELLDARYAQVIRAVATRGMSESDVRKLIDNGPYLSEQARSAGLIDDVRFEGEPPKPLVDAIDYSRAKLQAGWFSSGRKIAILVADGDLVESPLPSWVGPVLDPGEFIAATNEIAKDNAVSAVIVRIDSPGGDAIASDRMLFHLERLAKAKPVIVSMSDLAASAGYSLALGGKVIVARPETITGSIGVFFGKVDLSGLYSKLGINREILSRGRFASMGSESRGLTPEEEKKLRELVEATYHDFVQQVASHRRMRFEEAEAVAQGRVWLGTDAKARKLVDELGGLDLAVELAKRHGNVAANQQVEFVFYPRPPEWLSAFKNTASPLERRMLWKRAPWTIDVR